MSLAASTLIYEWRRYLAAVIALSVAGLLVLAMAGLFMGLSKSFTATVDRSPAQIMVLPPQAENLFGNNSQPRHIIPEIYEQPDVLEARALGMGFVAWSNFPRDDQPAKTEGVQVIVIDPEQGSVTLPRDFGAPIVEALRESLAVVADRSELKRLGVQVGDKGKINGRTVWVRATIDGYPSLFNSMIFMSRQTAKLLSLVDDGPRVGPIVVRIKDGANATRVAAELNALAKGRFKAWSREDLSDASQRAMLTDGGVAVMLGFAVVVGIFIGIVITWQTLQGAVMANLREFASLRALGVSMGRLRLIILELSAWVGVAGLLLTGALTGLVWILAKTCGVPMDFPLFVDMPVAVSLFVIALLSGVFSLRVLNQSQPADLLR
jgi:putative ABC transport system permease protein